MQEIIIDGTRLKVNGDYVIAVHEPTTGRFYQVFKDEAKNRLTLEEWKKCSENGTEFIITL